MPLPRLNVTIELTKLELVGKPKDKLTPAEPNMWTLFFRYDAEGLNVEVNGLTKLVLSGEPECDPRKPRGTHQSLNEVRVKENGTAKIPADIGRYPLTGEQPLTPFALAEIAPVVGVVYVVTEWDWTRDEVIDAARDEFYDAVCAALNQVIVEVNLLELDINSILGADREAIKEQVEQRVIAAAKAEAKARLDIGSVVDRDDFIGADVKVFSTLDLVAGSGDEQLFSDFATPSSANPADVGRWKVHGRVSAIELAKGPAPVRPPKVATR